MKLKRLRLHGFKSFADRTEIGFHEGITAIVGPNGCGKSNISDAVRWVLGEQRPTAIRGAKMEEAIFQGTVNRRPVNRGSVTMEISNEAGALPVPFEEVEIARTVYRDGGSDYQLNRSSCRLRDIQDLCRDTGLGANAYAVIEGRMVDAILSDRADERRSLFEEAAGIGKYKDRRKSALRRLERTEADVQRLEDLIGEVESKVRSLARQKGKAERYTGLRKRRLDVEVSVVRRQLKELDAELRATRELLKGGLEQGQSLETQIATAESRLETLRAEQLQVERARGAAAARVEELRTELVQWERDLAVAGERESYAHRRLEQIAEERKTLEARVLEVEREGGKLEARGSSRAAELDELRSTVAVHRQTAEGVQARLAAARETLDEVEGREREVTRRTAQLQGDAEAAETQAGELGARIRRIDEDLEEGRASLAEVRSQGDLFGDQLQSLEDAVSEAEARVREARTRIEAAREELETARSAEARAQDRAGSLETRLAALEKMERDREGMAPVLKALLSDPPAGVLGVLADYLQADPEVSNAVEAVLGATMSGVVVRDSKAAAGVTRWFDREWSGGGGLVLLPLDCVPRGRKKGSLLARVECTGEGAPWVRALLHQVEFVEGGDPDASDAAGDRVTAGGLMRTRQGLVRVGNPLGTPALLERKEELRALRRSSARARAEADASRKAREAARGRLREEEEALETARRELQSAEDTFREARAHEAERIQRRLRVERTVEEFDRQREAAELARERALERAENARGERDGLASEEGELRARRADAREALDRVQQEWDEVRARVSDLTVQEARLEGEVDRIRERAEELERAREAAALRMKDLEREEAELRSELDGVRGLRTRGEEETRRLFSLQDEARALLKQRDDALQTLQERVAEAERAVRQARSAEREASESRHRHELRAQELEGRIGRIQERLEGEWGRSLEQLLSEAEPVEGEPEALREELREIVAGLDRLGPVNMLAVEEHEEESARLAFLREQHEDLVAARGDLRSAIREINQTATRLFTETFEAIRANFKGTFVRLFQGGECDIWLEDPDDPLESDIEIHASPRGKRTQRIELLSGGERALTALALLFGIYLVKPSPFCVLDEVDAPLDESNIGRFIRLLQEFKGQTQFIVITHNPRTIEAADWIYGVTMEEPGVSSVVGVRLEEALDAAGV